MICELFWQFAGGRRVRGASGSFRSGGHSLRSGAHVTLLVGCVKNSQFRTNLVCREGRVRSPVCKVPIRNASGGRFDDAVAQDGLISSSPGGSVTNLQDRLALTGTGAGGGNRLYESGDWNRVTAELSPALPTAREACGI